MSSIALRPSLPQVMAAYPRRISPGLVEESKEPSRAEALAVAARVPIPPRKLRREIGDMAFLLDIKKTRHAASLHTNLLRRRSGRRRHRFSISSVCFHQL